MKALKQTLIFVMIMVSATAGAEDVPQRVSIAPENDLSAVVTDDIRRKGFGSAVCGAEMSEAFRDGYAVGTKNNHFGKRNILVIDDGKSSFPVKDKDTGYPVVILTDGKITKELQDLVRGYNAAMRRSFEKRKKKTERGVAPSR